MDCHKQWSLYSEQLSFGHEISFHISELESHYEKLYVKTFEYIHHSELPELRSKLDLEASLYGVACSGSIGAFLFKQRSPKNRTHTGFG